MNITELEALLFLLCCLLGWRLYVKNGALLVLGARNVMLQAMLSRVSDGTSVLKRTGNTVEELPTRPPVA